jgi:hypothetical protein
MKSVLLRVPDDLHARVKAKAARERRSLNAHVLYLLECDAASATTDRRNVRQVGGEWRCEAGQNELPFGCDRHGDHYWCETCLGFYGVPHDGIHEGPDAHPAAYGIERQQCACRPCRKATGRA